MKIRYPPAILLGLAGIVCAALVDVACPRRANAQGLFSTFTVGKTYNIATGEWITAQQTSLELEARTFTFYGTLFLDRGRIFEHDFGTRWDKEKGRFTFSAGGDVYRYSVGGYDWVWNTSVRVRLR